MNDLKAFFMEEDGLGTIEIIILIIVLIGLALLFQDKIRDFVGGMFGDGGPIEADDTRFDIKGVDE